MVILLASWFPTDTALADDQLAKSACILRYGEHDTILFATELVSYGTHCDRLFGRSLPLVCQATVLPDFASWSMPACRFEVSKDNSCE
jgi:hypothetical protein